MSGLSFNYFKFWNRCPFENAAFVRVAQVIHLILPVKARAEVDRLLAELQDVQFKLEVEPTTTVEYVHSLTLLDDIHERVSRLAIAARSIAMSQSVCVSVCLSV